MKALAFAVAFAFLSTSAVAAPTDPQSLTISSTWMGEGPSGKSEMTIQLKEGRYFVAGRELSARLVLELAHAIDASAISAPNAANLGVTQAWLQESAVEAFKRLTRGRDMPMEMQRLFYDAYRNSGSIEKRLNRIYSRTGTDDMPAVNILLRRINGESTRVTSQSQNAFMLPWRVVNGKSSIVTYNADIGKSLARLLPEKFTNRSRLVQQALETALAGATMNEVGDQWNLLQSQQMLGHQLDSLKPKYKILKSQIAAIGSVDLDTSDGIRWNGILERQGLPRNFVISVSLKITGDKVGTLDDFHRKIDGLADLALSVSWLSQYLKRQPETQVKLRFVDDRSINARAFEKISDTLGDARKPRILRQIQEAMPFSAFLEIEQGKCYSRWVVLPDRRMVMWGLQGCETALNWRPPEVEILDRMDAFLLVSSDGVALKE